MATKPQSYQPSFPNCHRDQHRNNLPVCFGGFLKVLSLGVDFSLFSMYRHCYCSEQIESQKAESIGNL